jgi:hypothetical protein
LAGTPLTTPFAFAVRAYAAAMALADSHSSLLAGDQTQLIIVIVAVLLILAIIGVTAILRARRGGGAGGYPAGGDVIVRCRDGHLFTTIWIPLMSFKAIRLGPVRFQYCPVGDHFTFVTIVRDSDLTPYERQLASQIHDRRIP